MQSSDKRGELSERFERMAKDPSVRRAIEKLRGLTGSAQSSDDLEVIERTLQYLGGERWAIGNGRRWKDYEPIAGDYHRRLIQAFRDLVEEKARADNRAVQADPEPMAREEILAWLENNQEEAFGWLDRFPERFSHIPDRHKKLDSLLIKGNVKRDLKDADDKVIRRMLTRSPSKDAGELKNNWWDCHKGKKTKAYGRL